VAYPIDVIIDPLAVITFGLVGTQVEATEGLGLNTFGFLWPSSGIWIECAQCADNITTVWVDCEGC